MSLTAADIERLQELKQENMKRGTGTGELAGNLPRTWRAAALAIVRDNYAGDPLTAAEIAELAPALNKHQASQALGALYREAHLDREKQRDCYHYHPRDAPGGVA